MLKYNVNFTMFEMKITTFSFLLQLTRVNPFVDFDVHELKV